MVAFGFYPCSLNKVHQIYKTSYSFKNSHNNDANVVQCLQVYASNFHESWKGWSEALETCQTTEWPGHSESYNTLKENGDMVNGKQAAIRHHSQYGTPKRSKTGTKIDENSEMTSDHMKECLTLSKLQASFWKNKKSLGPDGVIKKCLHTWTKSKILKIYNHILSSCILLQIWWEAIIIPVPWSDFWQEAHMEVAYYPSKADYNT